MKKAKFVDNNNFTLLGAIPSDIFINEIKPKIHRVMHTSCALVSKSWNKIFTPAPPETTEYDVSVFIGKYGSTDFLNFYHKTLGYPLLFYREDLMEKAKKHGNYVLLKWLKSNSPEQQMSDDSEDVTELYSAVRKRDTSILDRILQSGGTIPGHLANFAARKNCIDVLKWMMDNDEDFFNNVDTVELMEVASSKGNIDVLEFMAENGCNGVLKFKRLAVAAAENGQLDLLKWLVQKGSSISETIYKYAIRSKNVNLLLWLSKDLKLELPVFEDEIISRAAYYGDAKVMQWLYDRNPDLIDPRKMLDLMREAVKYGNISVVKWLRAKGCTWTPNAMKKSILNNSPHLLGKFRRLGYSWQGGEGVEVADKKNVKLLNWMKRNGFQWSLEDSDEIAGRPRLDVDSLKFAIENGCPWDRHTCYMAYYIGKSDCVDWLHEIGCKCSNKNKRNKAKSDY